MFDTEEERNLSPIIDLQKAYLAPELMLRAKHYTDAVNSWACGCIIAEMCTGKRLFPHIGDKHDVDPYSRGITRVLGTITTEKWPTANQLPLWPACLPQHPEVDFTWLFPSLGVHGCSCRSIQRLMHQRVWELRRRDLKKTCQNEIRNHAVGCSTEASFFASVLQSCVFPLQQY